MNSAPNPGAIPISPTATRLRYRPTGSLSMRLLILAFALTASSPGMGAQQWCSSTVDSLWVANSGMVHVRAQFRADHLRLCSIKESITFEGHTVDAVTCASWFSAAKQAIASAKSVTIYYPDTVACNALPTYSAAPLPGYVMLNN